MLSQYSEVKKFTYEHKIIYIVLKLMGPYVGMRPKIVITVPKVFWSKFFSDHACRNLEMVFLIYIYLMPNRHQHNEIQLCYLKTYRRTEM